MCSPSHSLAASNSRVNDYRIPYVGTVARHRRFEKDRALGHA
jgi:hypothetical protein